MRSLTGDMIDSLSGEDIKRVVKECMDHAFKGTLPEAGVEALTDTLCGYDPEDFYGAGTRSFKDALAADIYEKLVQGLQCNVPTFERFEACFGIFMEALSASLNRMAEPGAPVCCVAEDGIPEMREPPCRDIGRQGIHELAGMAQTSGLSDYVISLVDRFYAGGGLYAGDALRLTTLVDKMAAAPGYLRFLDKDKKLEETTWLLKVLSEVASCREDDDRADLMAAIGIMLFNVSPSARTLAGLSGMKPSPRNESLVYGYNAIMALNRLLAGDADAAAVHADAALENAPGDDERSRIRSLAGCISIRQGKPVKALSHLGEASRMASDRRLKGLILFYRGVIYYEYKSYSRAIECFTEALAYVDKKEDLMTIYNNVGASAVNAGELARAREALEAMEGIARGMKGDHVKRCRLSAYGYMGIVSRMEGDAGSAAEYHEKALRLAMLTGRVESIAGCLGNLGLAHRSMGDFGLAIQFFHSCMSCSERAGYWPGIRFAYQNISRALLDCGRQADEEKFCRDYVTRYPELSGLR